MCEGVPTGMRKGLQVLGRVYRFEDVFRDLKECIKV